MDNELELRFVNYVGSILGHQYLPQNSHEWFISFGTLLYFLRDKPMGIKFKGDFDVSLIHGQIDHQRLITSFGEYGFVLKNKVVDDRTGIPFQLVFKSEQYKTSVDVYFWVKANGYWWHTYDYQNLFPKKGVLPNYIFKGTNKHAFEGDYSRYTWDDRIPALNLPKKYGTLLDIWYPGWFIPDRNFGQSHAEKTVELKTCKHLKEYLK